MGVTRWSLDLKHRGSSRSFQSVTILNYTCTLCSRTIKTQSADYLIGVNLRLVIDSKQLNDETVIISKMLINLNDAQTQGILNKNFDFIFRYYLNISQFDTFIKLIKWRKIKCHNKSSETKLCTHWSLCECTLYMPVWFITYTWEANVRGMWIRNI